MTPLSNPIPMRPKAGKKRPGSLDSTSLNDDELSPIESVSPRKTLTYDDDALDEDEEELDSFVHNARSPGDEEVQDSDLPLASSELHTNNNAYLSDIIEKQRLIFNNQPLPTKRLEIPDQPLPTKNKPRQPKEKRKPHAKPLQSPTEARKRKRGRPRKALTPIDSEEDDEAEEADDDPPEPVQRSPPKKRKKNNSETTLAKYRKKSSEDEEMNSEATPDDDDSSENDDGATDNSKNEPDSSSYTVHYSKDEKGAKSKIFRCMICKKDSSAKADLIKHIRVHTGERPYKCKECPASFVQITALRGHETIHSGNKPFMCDLCGKKFAIKDRLRLHMRVHTGEKPHKCSKCDLVFARRSQVSQHMRIHDTTKSRFKCDECGASFSSYHTLKSHANGHLGIKEFQCCACGKKFLRVEGMYKHVRTVHRGNRPYTCNICGKAFKGHLQQHMRLHRGIRPYTCHLCDAAFTQNSQLTVHLRIHTGERPYKCQVCGASFAHSSACKIHMRSHTGEKPFKCVLCSNSFSQLPHLKKHMKCVHGADKPYLCTICKDFFKTQAEIDAHRKFRHNIVRTAEQEAQETVEEATLAKLRNRLAVLLYRISSEDRRTKFGFGHQIIDEVLKLSLESAGHKPIKDPSLAPLEELRQNVLQLLRWTIPQDTMEEYHRNNMTVDEVLDMLTS